MAPVSSVAGAVLAPGSGAEPDGRGPLQPVELATAAVLGAMTVVLVVAGLFLPHATTISALGAVPMGVIAHRHRPRAVVAAVVASASVGFLIAGTGVISTVVLCGLIGGLAGHAHRQHWRAGRLLAAAALIAPVVAAVVVGLLVVFTSLRKLTLQQLRNTWRGVSGVVGRVIGALPGLHRQGPQLSRDLDRIVGWAIRDWWQTVAVVVVAFFVLSSVLAWRLLEIVFVRLERIRVSDRLAAAGPRPPGQSVDPVPVRLRDVHVRYPGVDTDALAGVTLDVRPAEMLAVLGPNGSGKSTLSRVIAGCPPTAGDVEREGWAGLGVPGGTSIIAQQPESQVLGVRVVDDVEWGLPRHADVDTAALLAAVGLEGMERRETSGLSGGQLQRLAVAAALARRPRLLISDESTAMIDADGRRRLVALLRELPRRGTTVVHVTHRRTETVDADRVVTLGAGRVVTAAGTPTATPAGVDTGSDGRGGVVVPSGHRGSAPAGGVAPARGPSSTPVGSMARSAGPVAPSIDPSAVPSAGSPSPLSSVPSAGSPPPLSSVPSAGSPPPLSPVSSDVARATGSPAAGGRPRLRLRGVGHIYADRTPWAHQALHAIDLDIRAGEGILVVGGNGSGKSTLAWVLAGLRRPTTGYCELDGRPVGDQIGAVGLAFQHARLQVQRPTVGRDVRAAGGVGPDAAAAALRRVGLDPDELWDRAVDELSGGQLRRVALAGLLSRIPRVLVLDEPLAGLDDASRATFLGVLADLRLTQGLTLIVISHDLDGAGRICDRVVRLDAGRIVADGPLALAAGRPG